MSTDLVAHREEPYILSSSSTFRDNFPEPAFLQKIRFWNSHGKLSPKYKSKSQTHGSINEMGYQRAHHFFPRFLTNQRIRFPAEGVTSVESDAMEANLTKRAGNHFNPGSWQQKLSDDWDVISPQFNNWSVKLARKTPRRQLSWRIVDSLAPCHALSGSLERKSMLFWRGIDRVNCELHNLRDR